jgi:hypothetical protein
MEPPVAPEIIEELKMSESRQYKRQVYTYDIE